MRAAVLVAILLCSSPAAAVTVWDVDYNPTGFYGDGAYQFLKTAEDAVTVYLHETDWIFQGFYGEVELPSEMPTISFPVGSRVAVAVPHEVTRVPEPATLVILGIGLALLTYMRTRRYYLPHLPHPPPVPPPPPPSPVAPAAPADPPSAEPGDWRSATRRSPGHGAKLLPRTGS